MRSEKGFFWVYCIKYNIYFWSDNREENGVCCGKYINFLYIAIEFFKGLWYIQRVKRQRQKRKTKVRTLEK